MLAPPLALRRERRKGATSQHCRGHVGRVLLCLFAFGYAVSASVSVSVLASVSLCDEQVRMTRQPVTRLVGSCHAQVRLAKRDVAHFLVCIPLQMLRIPRGGTCAS